MILDQANQLALSCAELESGMRDEAEGDKALRALSRLRAAAERVKSSRVASSALPATVPFVPDARRRTSLVRIRKSLVEDDPAALFKSKKFETAIGSAEALAKDAESALNEAWRQHLEALLPVALEDEAAFPDLPGVDKAIASLQAANHRLKVASGCKPLDVWSQEGVPPFEQLEGIKRSIDKRNAALEKLADVTAQFPPSVRQFIEAVGTEQGAPLGLLTEDLLTWLKENGQMERYRVRTDGY